MNSHNFKFTQNANPYQPHRSEWLSFPTSLTARQPLLNNYLPLSRAEKSMIRSSQNVALRLRQFENEIENTFYRRQPRGNRRCSRSRVILMPTRIKGQSETTSKATDTTLVERDKDPVNVPDTDPINSSTKILELIDCVRTANNVTDLAKTYGPRTSSTSTPSESKSKRSDMKRYLHKTPTTVPLSPVRYLMFRPSQTGSVTSRVNSAKSSTRSSITFVQPNKRSRVSNGPTKPLSAKSSKILNVKRYEQSGAKPTKQSREVHLKSGTRSCTAKSAVSCTATSKALPSLKSLCNTPPKSIASRSKSMVGSRPVSQSSSISRSRSLEQDPRPSKVSLCHSSLVALPKEKVKGDGTGKISHKALSSNAVLKTTTVNSIKSAKNSSLPENIIYKANPQTSASDAANDRNEIADGALQGSSNNNDDCKSTASFQSDMTPRKGILKPRKNKDGCPLTNIGICTAQPGTRDWTDYWEKYEKALEHYKQMEAVYMQENQSYRQDIEKYTKEAARIALEDAIFRQSIGLEPKRHQEVIGHPLKGLTTLNEFVFDHNCGSEGLLAYLSSKGSNGFRLEIDVRGHDPDTIKVEMEFNLLKIMVPQEIDPKNTSERSIVIGLPHGYSFNDLEVHPVRNGRLVVESKEKRAAVAPT